MSSNRIAMMFPALSTPPPVVTTTVLPDADEGVAYSETLVATGVVTSWSVVTGTLPDGLSLNAGTGEISGTPTTAGTANITVRATGPGGFDEQEYTLTVNAAAPSLPSGLTGRLDLDAHDVDAVLSSANSGSAGGTWTSTLKVQSTGGPNGLKHLNNPDEDNRATISGKSGSDLVTIAGGGCIGAVTRINPSNCQANNNGGVFHFGVAFNLGSCNTGPRVQPAVWFDGLVQGPQVNVAADTWFAWVLRWNPVLSKFFFRVNGGAWQETSAPSGINGANTAIAVGGTRAGVGVTSDVDITEFITKDSAFSEADGDEFMEWLCYRGGLVD